MLRATPRETTKDNLRDTLQRNVPRNTPDSGRHQALDAELCQQSCSDQQLGATSQKAEPACLGHFHSRHVFQQQLIEKQKRKLQEQQKTILELKEHQRLAEARWAAERSAALMEAQKCLWANPTAAEEPKGTCQTLLKYVCCISMLFALVSQAFVSVVSGIKKSPDHFLRRGLNLPRLDPNL